MTFDEEIADVVERARRDGMAFAELEAAVAEIHRKHGREVPTPITGTIETVEPADKTTM